MHTSWREQLVEHNKCYVCAKEQLALGLIFSQLTGSACKSPGLRAIFSALLALCLLSLRLHVARSCHLLPLLLEPSHRPAEGLLQLQLRVVQRLERARLPMFSARGARLPALISHLAGC